MRAPTKGELSVRHVHGERTEGPRFGQVSAHRPDITPVAGWHIVPKGVHDPIRMFAGPNRSEERPSQIRATLFDLHKTLLDLQGAYRTATQQGLGPVVLAADGSLDTRQVALKSTWPPLWEAVMGRRPARR